MAGSKAKAVRTRGGIRRVNPWQRFRSSQGALLLDWVVVGNVGVIMHGIDARRDRNGRIGVSVWAKTPELLAEARDFLGIPFYAKVESEPFPHLVDVYGLPRERALTACGYKKKRNVDDFT